MTADDQTPCSALRADAERNRQKILEVACDVYATQGIDVPMAEIARQAGVGIATLNRRFPTRDDLITAAFAGRITEYADAVERALEEPDPWVGFTGFVEAVCGMQASDRGFTEVLTLTFPHAPAFEAERERGFAQFAELIRRAQEAGRLRPDFVHQDLVLILMANAGVIHGLGDAAPDAWRRLVAYLLQSFAADGATTLPDPPTQRAVYRAVRRLHPPAGGRRSSTGPITS